VERIYVRARTLCQHLEDSAQLFLVLWGLLSWYVVRADLQAAWEVGEQLLRLAQHQPDPALRMVADWALGQTLLFRGAFATARVHLDQAMALYHPQQHQALGVRAGFPGDLGVFCHCFAAHALWHLGYPDQALQRMHEALALAHALAHPYSRALALAYAAMLYQFRREERKAHEAAAGAMRLCAEHGFAYYLAWGTIMQGWALTVQGQGQQGLSQMRGGLAALQATGAALRQPYYRALLADACGQTGHAATGLAMLADALTEAHTHGECWHEAELYRLRGEVLLQSSPCGTQADVVPHAAGGPTCAAAEQCLQQALTVARSQQAKSLELRAAMSLSRLWQQQGRREAAYALLAPLYRWFTEGLDTADLQEAKALLEELEEGR
jgi:predicted ATPase